MKKTSQERRSFRRDNERRSLNHTPPNNLRRAERRNPDLGWIPLFRDVDYALISPTLSDCQILSFSPGTPLLKPGDYNQNVYIVLSGQVSAFLDANLSPGSAIHISIGECIGEMSAIDGKPVSALVLAISETTVLELPREVFWNKVMALPSVAGNLMISLTERMRRSNEQALKAQREQLELLHIKKELDVARKLQVSMLPLQRPLFPDCKDIEVCGFMEPASDVGGDLFDTFFVDEEHLFFCIGDVSGHGIASALFMARVIGLLRIMATQTLRPETLLESINERLCLGNETNLFVTMFCGYINVKSGHLIYSNGGHCAPIVSSQGHNRFITLPKGPLVGAFSGVSYYAMEDKLRPGDLLFCYTDGVTEAQNPSGAEFPEQKCLELIANSHSAHLDTLLDRLRREVSDFTETQLLEDDCTMLALRLTKP